MISLGLLCIFILFAGLMFLRKIPALLALPAMAISIGWLSQVSPIYLLNHIIAGGATKLAPVYVAVFMGAMMGRVLLQTGIAESIIKKAAEFGGEKPLWVSFGLLFVTALLFTTLQGLGAIITVGSLVLPVMMSLGVPRKMAGTLFLLAYATGFVFNPILFTLYRELLQLPPGTALPSEVSQFATILIGLMSVLVVAYGFWAAKRSGEILYMKETPPLASVKQEVPTIALLTPLIPLILYFGFHAVGYSIDFIATFLVGSLYGILTTQWRNLSSLLTSSAIKGLEDGAPAALLMMGIGMLLNALQLPQIKSALEPLILALPWEHSWFYVAFFGLLSPLALYRGPLNIFGIGIGLFSILFGASVLPPLALLAAVMCIVQVQNVGDPTNTHNVWIANFVGVRVEDFTRNTLLPMMLFCLFSLCLAAYLFFVP